MAEMHHVADDEETLAEYVTRTRRAQGLPDRIEDPAVIAQAVALLRDAWGANQDGH